jgi:hypothetical protein
VLAAALGPLLWRLNVSPGWYFPLFKNEEILYEEELYQLAWGTVESFRWSAPLGHGAGFFRPPWCSQGECNRFHLRSDESSLEVRELCLVSRQGYPYLQALHGQDLSLPVRRGETIFLELLLPTSSTAYPQGGYHIKPLFEKPVAESGRIVEELGKFDAAGRLRLAPRAQTLDAVPELWQEWQSLQGAVETAWATFAGRGLPAWADADALLLGLDDLRGPAVLEGRTFLTAARRLARAMAAVFHQARREANDAARYYANCTGARGRHLDLLLEAIHTRHDPAALPEKVSDLLAAGDESTAGMTDLVGKLRQLLDRDGELARLLWPAGNEVRPSGTAEPFTPHRLRRTYDLPSGLARLILGASPRDVYIAVGAGADLEPVSPTKFQRVDGGYVYHLPASAAEAPCRLVLVLPDDQTPRVLSEAPA